MKEETREAPDETIATNKIVVFLNPYCAMCISAKSIIEKYTHNYKEIIYEERFFSKWMVDKLGSVKTPAVFIDGEYVDIFTLEKEDTLKDIIV